MRCVNKDEQLRVILGTNPMRDDYHTGIRRREDILTFREAVGKAGADDYVYPDFDVVDAEACLEKDEMWVYSSKWIEYGTFVTPSYMMARDYAGGRPPYARKVCPDEVAWIDVNEGMYTGLRYETAEEAWRRFDTPIDDRECLTEPFEVDGTVFEAGTERYEVWDFFEKHFETSVFDLMFPSKKGRSLPFCAKNVIVSR